MQVRSLFEPSKGTKNNIMKHTDKELLDFLQKKNDERANGGLCLFRISDYGRGWRLHETKKVGAKRNVREAIADAIEKEKKEE